MDPSYRDVEDPPVLVREHVRRQPRMEQACRSRDPVHAISFKGALEIEKSIKKRVRPWVRLLKRSVRTGLFGLGTPIVSWEYLFSRLFNERLWPSGLSRSEILTLRTAKRMATYVDLPSVYSDSLDASVSEKDALKALKRFADVFSKKVLEPVFSDVIAIQVQAGREIEKVCPQVYGRECSTDREAERMFWGALSRGWALRCIPWKNYEQTRILYPYLDHWIKNHAKSLNP